MELTFTQKFEIEKFNRIVDNTETIDDLKSLTKQVFNAWQMQIAATHWAMKQSLPRSH